MVFDEESKNIYVGASDGSLQTWKGTACSNSKKLHTSAIHALCLHKGKLLTGSGDRTIKILNSSDLKEIISIECNQLLENSVDCSIRALDVWENKILVGTLGS